MEVRFNETYLKELYTEAKCDKKHRYQPQIIRKYIRMVANNLTPAYPTHPGEIVKDEVEYRNISQRQLAKQMGIAYSALNEILNGRRPITEKTALLFEAALGINAEPLLRLQMKYNLLTMAKDNTFMQRLEVIRRSVTMTTGMGNNKKTSDLRVPNHI